MNAIKKIVTGGAYEKPAKTEDGAFTTQGAENAHTTKGTSAEDPSIPGSGVEGKVDNAVDSEASKHGVPKSADSTINKEINKEI